MPEYSHINTNIIRSLYPRNTQVIIDVLECFVQEIDKDIDDIQKAVTSSLQQSVKSTSHKVKISFKMLGENKAATYCQQLEHNEKMEIKDQLVLIQRLIRLNKVITAEVLLFISELKEFNSQPSSVSIDNSKSIKSSHLKKWFIPIGQVPRSTLSEKASILVVEDNLANQKLIIKQLNSLGYSCDHANNGHNGLKKWQENQYKLILTDCYMPKVDGYQMAQSIRQLEASSNSKAIKIIAVTGAEMVGDDVLCYQAGMNSFIKKPVKLEDLKRILAEHYPHN